MAGNHVRALRWLVMTIQISAMAYPAGLAFWVQLISDGSDPTHSMLKWYHMDYPAYLIAGVYWLPCLYLLANDRKIYRLVVLQLIFVVPVVLLFLDQWLQLY